MTTGPPGLISEETETSRHLLPLPPHAPITHHAPHTCRLVRTGSASAEMPLPTPQGSRSLQQCPLLLSLSSPCTVLTSSENRPAPEASPSGQKHFLLLLFLHAGQCRAWQSLAAQRTWLRNDMKLCKAMAACSHGEGMFWKNHVLEIGGREH